MTSEPFPLDVLDREIDRFWAEVHGLCVAALGPWVNSILGIDSAHQ
ncbi:hypothetical protein [Streptoalloteichus hindustanus]|uniref:Uncharacterized protein n=1 Tax=Streptoalloteichus hindustanus TaxID=2017 RepID=A0A1M5FD17_STRHI|nr:hypothetical protein [Streptoalloteichus hindustanus]SHF89389.1 hypothetical protein SAMN05444320_105383 [Streptoalloteichus hindustanus]